MRSRFTLTLSLILLVGAATACKDDDEEMGPECAALEACCKGNATCQKIVDDDPEASCKAARPVYCTTVDAGTVTEASTPEASAPKCTKEQAGSCGGTSGCCIEGLECGYLNIPYEHKCCIGLGKTCSVGEDCCQAPSKIWNGCEGGKCCGLEGKICTDSADCCPSAPNCKDDGTGGAKSCRP